MAAYRLYAVDELGRINLADWIHADTDEEAIGRARQIEHGRALAEIWQDRRLVATLNSQDLAD